VEDGDTIVIDAKSRAIDWIVSEEEKARRREAWEVSGKSALKEKRGILFRYARDVAVSTLMRCPFLLALQRFVACKRRSLL